MPTRGALYMVWNRHLAKVEKELQASIASLKKHHPELPVHVHELPATATLLDKAGMYHASPFDETVFLDADTHVCARLDLAFTRAARHGVALCINEAPWAMRFENAVKEEMVEYNTGAIWFTKRDDVGALFAAWQRLARELDSSQRFKDRAGLAVSKHNDQCAFAVAVHTTGFNPFVLPLNFNYRPEWQKAFFGPIKVWHDHTPPPPGFDEYNTSVSPPNLMNFTVLDER